jgi:heptosyltransferase-1
MSDILLVKTSSMGDIIHNLPVVSDILAAMPEAKIDWVAEESFAEIPVLHPGVRRVIPVAIRRWRRSLFQSGTWSEIRRFVHALRATRYDMVLDSQGLIKSALMARLARGTRCGLDWNSAREPLASLAYGRKFSVNPAMHAVTRYRQLAAQAFGYPLPARLDYGVRAPTHALPWLPNGSYAVLLHATSRAEKLWPETAWIELAAHLHGQGMATVLPWGTPAERERSTRLAAQMAQAVVAPSMGLGQAATLLAHARLVVGVDTGLVHLATAVGVPAVGIYCGSDPARNGLIADTPFANLGNVGVVPTVAEVVGTAMALVK